MEELAGVQRGQLVDATLHDQVRDVEGLGGAVVVLSGGGVEGGAVEEEEIELCLPGRASPTAREAIEDVFQDQAVVNREGLGDPAGRGGEITAEVTPAAAVVASNSGPGAVVSSGGSVGAASSQAPEARCQRAVVALGGSRSVEGVECWQRVPPAMVRPAWALELEAGAGLAGRTSEQ